MSTNTPTPEVKTKPTKAIVGAAYSGVVAFLGGLILALANDDIVTTLEWATIASTTVIAVGGAAGLVYYTPNKPVD